MNKYCPYLCIYKSEMGIDIFHLKILTHESFFSEYVYRPLKDLQRISKKIFFPKKDLEK